MPQFSIVVPAFNARRFLDETLRSVLAQSLGDFELIAVDDGSTDDTLALLRSYERRDRRIRVITQANRGQGAARNAGVEAATAPHVVFLDADDLLLPWALASIEQAMRRSTGSVALLLASASWFSGATPRASDSTYPLPLDVATTTYPSILEASRRPLWYATTVMTCSRQLLRAAGGFHELPTGLEDLELALRLGARGAFVVLERPVTVLYRRHDGNASSNREKMYRGALTLLAGERARVRSGTADGANGRARRRIICRAVRAVSVGQARAGRARAAMHMWCSSLLWQLQDGRGRYVVALPLLALSGTVRHLGRRLRRRRTRQAGGG